MSGVVLTGANVYIQSWGLDCTHCHLSRRYKAKIWSEQIGRDEVVDRGLQ